MRIKKTAGILILGLAALGCVGMSRGISGVSSTTKDIVYTVRDGFDESATSLDIYAPEKHDEPLPVLVFIHGGGWSIGDKKMVNAKPRWANSSGWVFVSINYRLSPEVLHPEHARDAASAIAWVHEHIGDYGGDPERIAVIGHSAGAHIAAIVGSDESLLAEVGMEPEQLAGIVLLDGAGYDLTYRMENLPEINRLEMMYRNAFGDDKELWVRASPTLQAKPGDELPPLLAIYINARPDSKLASEGLVDAWAKTGAHAELVVSPEDTHSSLNRRLGTWRDPETKAVQAFLDSVFGED